MLWSVREHPLCKAGNQLGAVENPLPPAMALLRAALLCHLSVAGAVRLATNVACLPSNAEEVVLDLSGARAHSVPERDSPG